MPLTSFSVIAQVEWRNLCLLVMHFYISFPFILFWGLNTQTLLLTEHKIETGIDWGKMGICRSYKSRRAQD